jgi:regulator of protease activity HflC (stomatin/prohibitin superfamily)
MDESTAPSARATASTSDLASASTSAPPGRALGWLAFFLWLAVLPLLTLALATGEPSAAVATAALWVGTQVLGTLRRAARHRARGGNGASWSVRAAAWWVAFGVLAALVLLRWPGPAAEALERGRAALAPWTSAVPPWSPADLPLARWLTAVLALGGAGAAGLFAAYLGSDSQAPATVRRGASAWLRCIAWTCLLAALAPALALRAPVAAELLLAALQAALAAAAIELLGRAVLAGWRRAYDRVPHPGAAVLASAWLPALLGSRAHPLRSLFAGLADGFGVDLRGTYALEVMRRALLPIALALGLVGLAASALLTVPTGQVAVVERFGARRSAPLGPGLHLVWPWPCSRVTLVPTSRVSSLDIGFRGARRAADLLWTVQHADVEHTLLLGDGLELLAISATLEYRVRDPLAYTTSTQNPEQALVALAERELLRATVGRALDDVLSENLTQFGAEVRVAIQDAAERAGLGLEVLGLVLLGLHPPLAVAEDYQQGLAAQVDQDRQRAVAEGYAESQRLAAEGRAESTVAAAQSFAAERLARARGEAAAFESRRAAAALAPELYRSTAYLRALERALDGHPYHLIDARIEADGGAIWLLE